MPWHGEFFRYETSPDRSAHGSVSDHGVNIAWPQRAENDTVHAGNRQTAQVAASPLAFRAVLRAKPGRTRWTGTAAGHPDGLRHPSPNLARIRVRDALVAGAMGQSPVFTGIYVELAGAVSRIREWGLPRSGWVRPRPPTRWPSHQTAGPLLGSGLKGSAPVALRRKHAENGGRSWCLVGDDRAAGVNSCDQRNPGRIEIN